MSICKGLGKFGKNLAEMIGKSEKNPQLNVFKVPLVSIINMNHELVGLSRRIDCKSVDKNFEEDYHYTGRPAVPVREMGGSMLLKQMYKIYSFHDPHVHCISKGKDHKKYEFGNKSGLVITKTSGIIVGALSFEGNPYDGHTLEPQLQQVEDILGVLPKTALVDRGYKGTKKVLGVEIKRPESGKGKTPYEKSRDRKRFRRRAAIEPIIGHLKSDYRMLRNYLKGAEGDKINTIMAATAFNLMKKLMGIRKAILFVFEWIFGYPCPDFILLPIYQKKWVLKA